MYIPRFYRNSDFESIKEFIKSNSFGILVSNGNSKILATHIPLQWFQKENKNYLLGHISKANIQKDSFFEDSEVLCIFSGANTYISSSWYNHDNVPTWNYMAAHVYGKIKIVSDRREVYQMMDDLMNTYEQNMENPMKMSKLSEEYIEDHLNGIVCFSIEISSVECAFKLSQNRDVINKELIINELEKQNDDFSLAIAQEIKNGL
jgi:transcriptional regulator